MNRLSNTRWSGVVGGVLLAVAWILPALADSGMEPRLSAHVYKTPHCHCCVKWTEHLEQSGFEVEVTNVDDLHPVRERFGVPSNVAACHTALVNDNYFVEGHVPAGDIKRLLDQGPDVRGIAVPGMPVGSPGMEGPNPQPYSVFAINPDGSLDVFTIH